MDLKEFKQQLNKDSEYRKYKSSLKGRVYSSWLWLLGLKIRVQLRNKTKVNYNSEGSATMTFKI